MVNQSVLFSRHTFDVARVLSVLLVFVCHLFETFNTFTQSIVVSVFFFISGYGMEKNHYSSFALLRLPRYIFAFLFFSILYWFVYGVWFFPSAWYLLAYFMMSFLYRFFSTMFYLFSVSYVILSLFYYFADFEFCYYVSTFAFVYGVFVARYSRCFTLFQSYLMFHLGFVAFYTYEMIFYVFFIPLYLFLIFYISSFSCIRFLALFSSIVYPFFMSHCFILGLLGVTWTLGGSFDISMSFFGFLVSLVFAYFLWLYLPFFSKKKFLNFK